jgi:5'-3' exonuclease
MGVYDHYQNGRLIIDLNHLAHRNWSTTSQLANSYGEATGAIFGCLKSLMMLSDLFHPQQIITCRDTPNPFRTAVYPPYKANRVDSNRTVEELNERQIFNRQLDALEEILGNLGIPTLKEEELEADDIAALVAHRIPFPGETILVSGDKDFIQLVGRAVHLFSPMIPARGKLVRREGPEYDGPERAFWVKMRECGPRTFIKWVEKLPEGIPLERWLLYRLLVGDGSDNLAGVNGIGPAAALKTVQHFYSYDVLVEAGEEEWTKVLNRKQVANLAAQLDSGDLAGQWRCINLAMTLEADADGGYSRILGRRLGSGTINEARARDRIRGYEMASFLIDWKAFLRHFPAFYDYTASTALWPVQATFGSTLEISDN